MVKKQNRKAIREKKHARLRGHISGTASRPRLAVYRSNNIAAAAKVGEVIGQRAVEKGITEVVFDRGGYIYQGKVAALAEAARKAGLDF